MNAENFRSLYDYNLWANHLILQKTKEVSEPEDYLASGPGISFGSLHGTLLHLLNVERAWFSRWRGEGEVEPLIAEEIPDFVSLLMIWEEEERKQSEFLQGLSDLKLPSDFTFTFRTGREVNQPLWQLMLHTINHSMQFRSEAAVRLTQLDKSPGNLDMFIYFRQASAI